MEAEQIPRYQRVRRDRIVEVATELLRTQSYEEVQMRDIAASAEVALGTLYRYFPSKDQLYATVLTAWANPVREDPRLPLASAEARVRSKMHFIIAAFHTHPEFFKLLVILRSSDDRTAVQRLDEFNALTQRWLLEEMARVGEQAAEDYALMLWAVVTSAVGESIYRNGSAQDARRVVDRFIDLIGPRLVHG